MAMFSLKNSSSSLSKTVRSIIVVGIRRLTESPGIARNIFFQDERHADLVEQFFSENAYPRLSWMHDIHSQQWVDASTTLLEESTSEKLLGTRHVRAAALVREITNQKKCHSGDVEYCSLK
jgi:hypothetical protein